MNTPKLTFWCVSYHLGAFGIVWLPYKTRYKTGRTSKNVRVGIFCNERTRSTPLDPKLTFWCASYYLGAFEAVWLPYESRYKTVRTSAKVCAQSRVRIFRNECTRSNSLDCKLMFWCVLYHLGAFGTVWLPYETRCNTGRTSTKVRATKSHRNFCNKRTRSTPLDHKLTFWSVLYHLGAFGTVWLPYKTRCKTDRTSAKVRATKSCPNFSQRSHPIHPIGP